MFQIIPLVQLRRRSSIVDQSVNQSKLDASVKQDGILNPILVCKREHDTFLILDGHRRYWAAKRAGLSTIPAGVVDFNDEQIGNFFRSK